MSTPSSAAAPPYPSGGEAPPRRHPVPFWIAVVVAVVLLVGGVVLTVRDVRDASGPGGAVRAYFDALAAADAPAALALGAIPNGPRRLLTSTVLREQQHLAPITDVAIDSVQESGPRANVVVHYSLGFPGAARRVSDQVAVQRRGDSWRLVQVAVPTQLSVVQASERATILGGRIPEGTTLVFPGAVPIRFDTPYLQLRPYTSVVRFRGTPTTQILPAVTPSGQRAVTAAVYSALRSCLGRQTPELRCPQPDTRVVPGSLHGRIVGLLADQLTVGIGFGAAGVIDVHGDVAVRGRYRTLTFDNRAVPASGRVQVRLHAVAYAAKPLIVLWQDDAS